MRQFEHVLHRLDAGHARHADIHQCHVGRVLIEPFQRLDGCRQPRRRCPATAFRCNRPARSRSRLRAEISSSTIAVRTSGLPVEYVMYLIIWIVADSCFQAGFGVEEQRQLFTDIAIAILFARCAAIRFG